jgi:hypothetical protein
MGAVTGEITADDQNIGADRGTNNQNISLQGGSQCVRSS